jgi:hypothetical protein
MIYSYNLNHSERNGENKTVIDYDKTTVNEKYIFPIPIYGEQTIEISSFLICDVHDAVLWSLGIEIYL